MSPRRARGAGCSATRSASMANALACRARMSLSPLRRIDHALAGRLRIEERIGFHRLFELPAVRKQMVDIDLAIRDETRTRGLAHGRERPRADQRHLPAQQIVTHIEGDIV